jgi:recombination protein RecA
VVVSLARLQHDSRLHASAVTVPRETRENGWCLAELGGRLVQLEGAGDSAALTLAFTVILEAQQCGEQVAWITPRARAADAADSAIDVSVFYPPDAHETGIDLAALPVVRAPDVTAAFAAADLLLRSGGFGLIVADLGDSQCVAASTSLARLAGLARRHHTALLFLTQSSVFRKRTGRPVSSMDAIRPAEPNGSLGSLISLHVQARRERIDHDRFRCGLVVLKDKQRGPVWEYTELCRGAVGLR